MTSFALVFFFSVTGLTLNHPLWFANQLRTSTLSGTLDPSWAAPGPESNVKRLEIVEYLRATHGLEGAVSDFRVSEEEGSLTFTGPGYSADVFIDRATGEYRIVELRMGLAAVLNDLHKGRDSGGPWKALIDVSAVLLVFVSLTGLVLLFFLHKHRTAGLLALAAGGVLVYVIYAAWVP